MGGKCLLDGYSGANLLKSPFYQHAKFCLNIQCVSITLSFKIKWRFASIFCLATFRGVKWWWLLRLWHGTTQNVAVIFNSIIKLDLQEGQFCILWVDKNFSNQIPAIFSQQWLLPLMLIKLAEIKPDFVWFIFTQPGSQSIEQPNISAFIVWLTGCNSSTTLSEESDINIPNKNEIYVYCPDIRKCL